MFKAKVLWQLSNPFIRLTYAFALCTRWILGMPCGSRHPPWFWWPSISIFGEVLMLMLLIDTNRHGCTSMLGLLPIKSSNSVFNIFDLCLCYFLFMWFGYMGSVYQKVTVPKSSCELRHSQGVFSQKGCINVISGHAELHAKAWNVPWHSHFPVTPSHCLSTQSSFSTNRLRCLLATLLNLCRHVSWWPGSLKLWCVSPINNHKVKMVLTEMKWPTACILGMSYFGPNMSQCWTRNNQMKCLYKLFGFLHWKVPAWGMVQHRWSPWAVFEWCCYSKDFRSMWNFGLH